ncbi:family 1 glycosylhydrolase [Spirosoma taeanense]|uniref:Family 1 glycosylhydrolase n=2 Tax=Spirosoma taeanense TaxID=2735870 RepID=A0A6M5YDY7_9BACT|nr:family 1 glycosylhydrolase [Spirosoma taeanense]
MNNVYQGVHSTTTHYPGSIPLELWGGIECTVNRIGEVYQDQLIRNGHHDRLKDLDEIAALGIRTLRYPLLWERTAPECLAKPDWHWADERMAHLRQLSIRPIVGLVHHGCGPRYATFNTPRFETELAHYARQVAERYPWVDAYTPINEPLTTARFSGLYGHWYPHERSDRQFVAILLRECRATVLAMRAIRTVRPDAKLIQTEDLGQTHCMPELQYQADFENHRRWLTWDLLCGSVTPQHPLWKYLRRAGASEQELWYLVENASPPYMLGVNHYVTSERYLYCATANQQKGSKSVRYHDTEVVRAAPELRVGISGLLTQAAQRYGLPIAVTEAHLGCTPDEQMRWLGEVWQQAEQVRTEGVDVRAVTVWGMLGLYDWHCLLTRCENHYEPSVFDVRTGKLQRTELAAMVEGLAACRPVSELIPDGLGWWQTEATLATV